MIIPCQNCAYPLEHRQAPRQAPQWCSRCFGLSEDVCRSLRELRAAQSLNEDKTREVTVCAACLKASCWHGVLLCEESRGAATVKKTVAELDRLGLEHPSHYCARIRSS